MTLALRKIVMHSEKTFVEGGKTGRPVLMAAVAAVIRNPWAGDFTEDLRPKILEIAPALASELVPSPRGALRRPESDRGFWQSGGGRHDG